MKIGFDAKRAFYNRSGLGNYSRNTIQSLSKFYPDIDFNLFTPSLINAIDFKTNPNVKISIPGVCGRMFKSYWRSFSMTGQLIKEKIDLYHGLSAELPGKINKSGIKSVVTVHDLIFLRFPELYKSFDRNIYKKKTTHACNVSDKIIAISRQTKEDIMSFLKVPENKIEVIYQNCNPSFYNTADEAHKEKVRNKYKLPVNYILYVGTVEKRKNLLNLIKGVYQEGITHPVVVVGRPTDYMNKVRLYISEKKMAGQVLFYDFVENEDLPVFYQLADLFIYPSIFEGFGIPIIEALHSGTPVITSNKGCFPEAGGPDSLYIDPENTQEIGFSIKTLLSDNKRREIMAVAGKVYAERFLEKTVAENLMNFYLHV
jgi:glycosyltransferase involved in cell wall biosynthesis